MSFGKGASRGKGGYTEEARKRIEHALKRPRNESK